MVGVACIPSSTLEKVPIPHPRDLPANSTTSNSIINRSRYPPQPSHFPQAKMGRHSFAAQNINKSTQSLLNTKRLAHPPPAFIPLATFPPSTRLVRPPKQRSAKPGSKRTSRLFAPLSIGYQEDRLRWEYFNDHPWELARPRVMLESDGRDHERWDWSLPLDFGLLRPVVKDGEEKVWDRIHAKQSGRPINGEAYVLFPIHPLHLLLKSTGEC